MVRLKQCREEVGLTQEQVAESIHATKEEIVAWESGKTPIPNATLKDLAIALDCTIENIVDKNSTKRRFYAASLAHTSNPDSIGLYGGVYLLIKGIEEQLDFPIGEEQSELICRFFDGLEKEKKPGWLVIETLDNWTLFVNLEKLIYLDTYDDDAEESPQFDHPEVYRALTKPLDLQQQELSETLLNYCKKKSKEIEEREKKDSCDYYNEAQVYTEDGRRFEIFLEKSTVNGFYEFQFIRDEPDRDSFNFLKFETEYKGGILPINLDHVSLIQMPTIAYNTINAEIENESEDAA